MNVYTHDTINIDKILFKGEISQNTALLISSMKAVNSPKHRELITIGSIAERLLFERNTSRARYIFVMTILVFRAAHSSAFYFFLYIRHDFPAYGVYFAHRRSPKIPRIKPQKYSCFSSGSPTDFSSLSRLLICARIATAVANDALWNWRIIYFMTQVLNASRR